MDLKNLNIVLDKWIPPFFPDSFKIEVIEAVKKDIDILTSGSKDLNDWVLSSINRIFNKKYRVISKSVLKKYATMMKSFTKEEVLVAMNNARDDDWHKQTGHKYCTIVYFSRVEQIDKWLNLVKSEKIKFEIPVFNIKEG